MNSKFSDESTDDESNEVCGSSDLDSETETDSEDWCDVSTDEEEYQTPVCSKCNRKICSSCGEEDTAVVCSNCNHTICKTCHDEETKKNIERCFEPKDSEEVDPRNNESGPAINVFLVARSSFGSAIPLGHFETVFESVKLAREKPAPFEGGKFLPGYDKRLELRGQFAGHGNGLESVFTMDRRCATTADDTSKYEGNFPTFSELPRQIVRYYKPGDLNIIAMLHPTGFILLPFAMKEFIEQLETRGIPKSSLLFFAFGLRMKNNGVLRQNTLVTSSGLLKVINEKQPLYACGPPGNAWFFTCETEYHKERKAVKEDAVYSRFTIAANNDDDDDNLAV